MLYLDHWFFWWSWITRWTTSCLVWETLAFFPVGLSGSVRLSTVCSFGDSDEVAAFMGPLGEDPAMPFPSHSYQSQTGWNHLSSWGEWILNQTSTCGWCSQRKSMLRRWEQHSAMPCFMLLFTTPVLSRLHRAGKTSTTCPESGKSTSGRQHEVSQRRRLGLFQILD